MAYFGDPPRDGARKWQFCHQPSWIQRYHFIGNNDMLEKRRLAKRTHGFTRHKVYNSRDLVQPSPYSATHYAPEDERLNKDFESVLKRENAQRKNRYKELLAFHEKQRVSQEHKLMMDREIEWQTSSQRENFYRMKPHGRIQANKSGACYDIFTLDYKDTDGGARLKHADNWKSWRARMREIRLQKRSSSCPNYNLITWEKGPSVRYPEEPTPLHLGEKSKRDKLSPNTVMGKVPLRSISVEPTLPNDS